MARKRKRESIVEQFCEREGFGGEWPNWYKLIKKVTVAQIATLFDEGIQKSTF